MLPHAALQKINEHEVALNQEGYSVIFYDSTGRVKRVIASRGKALHDSFCIYWDVCCSKPARCSLVLFGKDSLAPSETDMLLLNALFEPLRICKGLIVDDVILLGRGKYFSCKDNRVPIYLFN